MGILSGALNQTATYWEFSGVDQFGDSLFEAPVTILVRWEDESKLVASARGQERITQSMVWYDEVEDISVNSFLALGDETAHSDPRPLINAYVVKETNFTVDLFGQEKVRWIVV